MEALARLREFRAWLVAVAVALSLVGGCAKGAETEEQMMKAGLDALYARRDPAAAAAQFRKVLEKSPNHYGATFQLAMALEQAGQKDEARPIWQRSLTLAEAAGDAETAATARARLAPQAAPPAPAAPAPAAPAASAASADETLMKTGLDLLYQRNDPNGAAAQFRRILERNPRHYGATFQLAMALDRAGKPAEARPIWEKVLKMAEESSDRETMNTAKARLAKKP
jgi:tetratricopeptide (TPR) repeat protein